MTKEELENIAKDIFKEKPIGYEHNFELKIYQDGFAEGYEYCLESTVLTDNTETIENALNRIKELEDALEYTRKLYGDELEKAYKEINNTNGTLQVAKEMSNESLREKNRALRGRISEAKDIIFDLVVALRNILPKISSSWEEIERAEKFLKEEK